MSDDMVEVVMELRGKNIVYLDREEVEKAIEEDKLDHYLDVYLSNLDGEINVYVDGEEVDL